MSKVPATYVEDVDEHEGTPGAWGLIEDRLGRPIGIEYICPCGCKSQGYLPFRNTGQKGDTWLWNGSKEKPTLQPSVHHIYKINGEQRTHYHGWLKEGVWEPA